MYCSSHRRGGGRNAFFVEYFRASFIANFRDSFMYERLGFDQAHLYNLGDLGLGYTAKSLR